MTAEHTDIVKTGLDILSISVVVGALVDLLPSIAALLSIVWLCIQISQSQRFAEFTAFLERVWRWLRGRRGGTDQ